MRKFHRWTSFPLVLLLFAVIGTGLYLQVVEILHEAENRDPAPLARTAPDRKAVLAAIDQALASSERMRPDFPLQKVEISFDKGTYVVKALTNRRIGPSVTIEGASGKATYVERPPRTLRTIFILLHSGKFFGMTGLIAIMLASAILMFLTVSGLWVYIDMYRRRRRAGKAGLFWH